MFEKVNLALKKVVREIYPRYQILISCILAIFHMHLSGDAIQFEAFSGSNVYRLVKRSNRAANFQSVSHPLYFRGLAYNLRSYVSYNAFHLVRRSNQAGNL